MPHYIHRILIAIADLAIWYLFIYLWLYTLKHDVNLWQNSLLLLVLAVAGTSLIPWVMKK